MRLGATLKRPSAFVPLVFSAAALAIVIGHVALYGVTRGGDEGAAAHLFQLLLAAEVPIVAYFALRWLPRDGKAGWTVLALQLGAVVVALAPVYILEM